MGVSFVLQKITVKNVYLNILLFKMEFAIIVTYQLTNTMMEKVANSVEYQIVRNVYQRLSVSNVNLNIY